MHEIIFKRIANLRHELASVEKISSDTKINSRISKDFLRKYDAVDEYKIHCINSFQTIGWADPFPDDDKKVDGSINDGHNLCIPFGPSDLVYPESKYIEEFPPLQIYIPKKEIMLKLMRASISVSTPEELWFNKKE